MVRFAQEAQLVIQAAIRIKAALVVVLVVAEPRLMLLKRAALVVLQTCVRLERRGRLLPRAALAKLALAAVARVAVVVVLLLPLLVALVALADKMAVVVEVAVLRLTDLTAVPAAMAVTALSACIAGKETHP
jgi:type III secretory pathway component EscT